VCFVVKNSNHKGRKGNTKDTKKMPGKMKKPKHRPADDIPVTHKPGTRRNKRGRIGILIANDWPGPSCPGLAKGKRNIMNIRR